MFDLGDQIEQKRQEIANKVNFKELEKTSEYMETHYFGVKNSDPKHILYNSQTRLMNDFA